MGPWREQEAPEGGVGVWPQPLGAQVQVKVQLEKFHYPKWAKGELLGPGHHQGLATIISDFGGKNRGKKKNPRLAPY